MKPRRAPISGMMLAVAFCGVGLAAIRAREEPWGSMAQTIAVILLLGAAIGAYARRGRARFVWAGFAVFGIVALGPIPMLHLDDLVPEYGLSLLSELSSEPALPDLPDVIAVREARVRARVCRSLGAIVFATIGAVVGGLVYRDDGARRPAPGAQDHLPPDLS